MGKTWIKMMNDGAFRLSEIREFAFETAEFTGKTAT